ncbi:thiamine biosynthesis protein ThiS [Desulfurobacterium indicum]|uniref:Thiamine biosynthesis protein ThiS n=1 Tax=Desulfurobacterium indicum TaxID=1914305 RepID=A0A1R1MMN2_9BACT|nr:thiamine biosynthesis protein ThiS [Desulfurobacterium indicum]OMH41075.1 thiamine biosynthesis protein ThiS [Desulfurobacterium indicum]
MHEIVVEIAGEEKKIPIKKRSIRVDSILEKLSIYPETAVVVKGKELLCDDDRINAGEKVKIIVATSKG